MDIVIELLGEPSTPAHGLSSQDARPACYEIRRGPCLRRGTARTGQRSSLPSHLHDDEQVQLSSLLDPSHPATLPWTCITEVDTRLRPVNELLTPSGPVPGLSKRAEWRVQQCENALWYLLNVPGVTAAVRRAAATVSTNGGANHSTGNGHVNGAATGTSTRAGSAEDSDAVSRLVYIGRCSRHRVVTAVMECPHCLLPTLSVPFSPRSEYTDTSTAVPCPRARRVSRRPWSTVE